MLETNKNAVTILYSGGDIQVPFLFYDAADLVVLFDITRKTLGTDYSVTGAGSEAGGKVNLLNPPANDTRVTVLRRVEFLQQLEIPSNGIIPEGALNRALDRIVMMVQQLAEQAERAVTYPEGTEKAKVANAGQMLDAMEQAQFDINNAVNVATETLESSNTALAASNKALNDAEAKRVQINNNGDTQVARILAEGNKQDSRVETEGDKQHSRVETEGNEQASRITTEGNSQYNRVVSLRDSSVAQVDTHKVEGVASVNAAKQQALNTINAMPEYLANHEAILRDQIEKNFGGLVVGKSGKRRFVSSDTITATGVAYMQGWTVGDLTGISFAEGETPNWNDCVKETINGWRKVAITFGDSGEPYIINHIWRQLRLLPMYGDVCGDFTTGNTYRVLVFEESTDPADQQTGTRDVVEFFLGGNKAQVTGGGAAQGLTHSGSFQGYGSNAGDPTRHYLQVLYAIPYAAIKNTELSFTIKNNSSYDFTAGMFSTTIATSFQGNTIHPGETGTMVATLPKTVAPVYIRLSKTSTANETVNYQIKEIALDGKAIVLVDKDEYVAPKALFASAVDLKTVLPIDSHGELNVGYWEGRKWKSQLLGDARFDDAGRPVSRLVLKMADKVVGGLSTLEIRKANGTWQEFAVGYEANSLEYRFNEQQNYAIINVGSSYTVLGYTSEEDMRGNASARAKYQASARVWRPDHSDVNFSIPNKKVLLFATYGRGTGSLVHDLIGHIPTINGGTNTNCASILSSADNHLARNIGTSRYQSLIPRYLEPNSIAVLFRLVPRDGTLWMQARFKELIYNGNMDWGDNHLLDENGSDYLTTTTDDNGNVILQGVMSYDTGIPA